MLWHCYGDTEHEAVLGETCYTIQCHRAGVNRRRNASAAGHRMVKAGGVAHLLFILVGSARRRQRFSHPSMPRIGNNHAGSFTTQAITPEAASAFWIYFRRPRKKTVASWRSVPDSRF